MLLFPFFRLVSARQILGVALRRPKWSPKNDNWSWTLRTYQPGPFPRNGMRFPTRPGYRMGYRWAA